MLNPDLGSLFRFLDALDSQVAGRESSRPPAEMESQLLRMIRGETLAEEDRRVVFEALKKHPGWTEWLANQVKAARGQASPHRG
jgi:hypothetical protein